ncbi:hypothetical protein AACH06_26890 [Ideonella sp. DXS29W]|uniref:Cobalt-zinc-cadmium resistance protein n=1 Tax=Ideonella lacteola TaxID=2984193 RepID=A0ABU9C087_9BURK
MRRWLLIFLLAVMPMQLSWAALVGYCQHESAPTRSAHFGHHPHEHQDQASERQKAGETTASPGTGHAEGTPKSPLALDDDCSYCHLACGQAPGGATHWAVLTLPSPMVAVLSLVPESHVPQVPLRPDRRLA